MTRLSAPSELNKLCKYPSRLPATEHRGDQHHRQQRHHDLELPAILLPAQGSVGTGERGEKGGSQGRRAVRPDGTRTRENLHCLHGDWVRGWRGQRQGPAHLHHNCR